MGFENDSMGFKCCLMGFNSDLKGYIYIRYYMTIQWKIDVILMRYIWNIDGILMGYKHGLLLLNPT
jgi:hypothetical protein